MDVILAGDCFYEAGLAARVGSWLARARTSGIEVLVGDPGRRYLPAGDLVEPGVIRGPDDDGARGPRAQARRRPRLPSPVGRRTSGARLGRDAHPIPPPDRDHRPPDRRHARRRLRLGSADGERGSVGHHRRVRRPPASAGRRGRDPDRHRVGAASGTTSRPDSRDSRGRSIADRRGPDPVSATLLRRDDDTAQIAGWMQDALETASFGTESLSGPLEDGSFVLESVGEGDCRIQTRSSRWAG